ncbi:MAG TPA: aminopeptidase N [Rhodopila sp.]|uniref:aminopeptidase N n=1 Tax=Rhodopila sp. TaxID=2480087 RepID=UPI002D16F319|nr:aminopeptidase N [Rhodopila sp.]HVY14131.1 aminopeptidase N [Rhodopila sp.]
MPNDLVQADAPVEIRLADYRPPAFLVDTVALSFDLDPDATRVVARLGIRRNPAREAGLPLELDGEALTLVGITLDGKAVTHEVLPHGLRIPNMPDAGVLEIETRIAPSKNTELSGLYTSGGSFFTQCEAQGFRRITYFPDRPDVMSRYTVRIVADKATCPVMLSNGNPSAIEDVGGGLHAVTWTDPHPKPCYLFALVAGDLVSVKDSFTTRSGRAVALGIYVRRGDEDRCAHAMRSLKTSMTWDEEVFGLEYDLDVFNIAAVSDFNMGAMENKGLNVFNTKYVLARPETATDADYLGIESVIAHEYFHNWTGNRVTCRDWFQLSLKEGLTVYRDQEFSGDQNSRAVKRIGDVRALRAAQFREDAGPLAHPVQPASYMAIDNFYTATIYNKGAEVIRMMATIIGKDAFRRGMDLYFARHDNHAVTIDDFVQAMQDASGVDLTDFKRWYHQAGTPELTIEDEYDPAAKRYALTIRQMTKPTPGQPDKNPLVIPVAMGLLDGNGQELTTRLDGEAEGRAGTRVLLVTEPTSRFEFVDVASPPVPSGLRGFSAPVKLSGLSPDRLRFLAAHDTDPFVRWDSGQQFASQALLDMVASVQQGRQPTVDPALVEAAAAALDQEPALAAEALALPGEATLADRMTIVDVDAIHSVREMTRAAIAASLRDRLSTLYDTLTETGAYAIDGSSIGRRALRNTVLWYLNEADRAKAQFDARQNMTDVLAALSVLGGIEGRDRERALASFYEAWHGDALVLDKWFAIQALSSLPGTVRAVGALKTHTDFDLRNPNRVRALVGSFAANQVRFHDAAGAGYELYADTLIALDPANPQVAARMVSPLGQWRRFDPGRQALMKAQLQRVLDLPGLSRNTYEMVTKSLG